MDGGRPGGGGAGRLRFCSLFTIAGGVVSLSVSFSSTMNKIPCTMKKDYCTSASRWLHVAAENYNITECSRVSFGPYLDLWNLSQDQYCQNKTKCNLCAVLVAFRKKSSCRFRVHLLTERSSVKHFLIFSCDFSNSFCLVFSKALFGLLGS